ncbi:MAG TPA: cytochrome c [Usitatibacter sp.]|nr:cytochrome c [Usitatibacter sp.]
MKTTLAWIGGACLACLAAAAVTAAGGYYNFAADEPHLAAIESSIAWMRDRSVSAHAARPKAILPTGRASLQDGAQHYAAMCAGCHLAPGGGEHELHDGLYPAPPDLTRQRVDPDVAFWTIKHGVKMTGMPAWGRSHDDATILAIDAFIQKLPGMSGQDYRDLVGEGPNPEHDHPEHEAHQHSHGNSH